MSRIIFICANFFEQKEIVAYRVMFRYGNRIALPREELPPITFITT